MRGVRAALSILLVLGAVALAGTGAATGQAPGNPLAGMTFYVDKDSESWLEWQRLQRSGETAKADLIWTIAREPKALWLGRWTRPNFFVKVNRLIEGARAEGAVPIFTVMRAQSTKCSRTYDGGGPAEDARTRAWYDDLARAIGSATVVIAFEPDSLGTIDCHAKSRRDDRYRLLAYGVDVLSKLPNATIYIEAGASDWEPAHRMAKRLRKVGIAKVRGFMLNATHMDWTRSNIRYGVQLSRLVGGKHFIVNTAENGRGPVHYRTANGRRITVWCNPGKRGLGPPPTTNTSHPLADAYLWINRPGYAQICQGHPIKWYLPRALEYARYATDWEAPPRGTRFGHARRYPLRVFGIPR